MPKKQNSRPCRDESQERSRGTTQIPSDEGTLRGRPRGLSPAPVTVGVRLA